MTRSQGPSAAWRDTHNKHRITMCSGNGPAGSPVDSWKHTGALGAVARHLFTRQQKEPPVQTHTQSQPSPRPEHPLIPAGRVKDTAVYNRAGEKIGKVEDIAIDKVGGQVAYAILSFGGFLGMGERYHPVPWALLSYDPERRGYVIPCDKDVLERAPTFEADELSGWDDTDARFGIYNFYEPYGAAPYWMWAR